MNEANEVSEVKGNSMDTDYIIKVGIIVIIILLIYYAGTWQKKKQEKELKEMQNSLKKGDKIITFSGLAGIVEETKDDRIIVSTYPSKTLISIEKWAVAGLDDRTIE